MTGPMVDMIDGVNVAQWPAGARFGLVYTDGRFANQRAVMNRFPGIVLQTISAVGTGPAMWVDCEPGCVWPPRSALDLYVAWRGRGCRGIYCTQATKPVVKEISAGLNVPLEIFGADWTGVRHINPDEAQTQYLNTPGYDVSAIPAPVAPAPSPGPAPTPQPIKADSMRVVVATSNSVVPPQHPVTAGQHFLLFDNALLYVIESQADITAWIDALGPAAPISGGFLGNIPPLSR